jgi:hypothetical protein
MCRKLLQLAMDIGLQKPQILRAACTGRECICDGIFLPQT